MKALAQAPKTTTQACPGPAKQDHGPKRQVDSEQHIPQSAHPRIARRSTDV